MAHNNSYPAYTPGAALPNLSYEGIYWPSPKEEEEEKEIMANSHLHSSKELPPQEESNDLLEQDLQNQPEVSPRSSSSATLSHYTPDSATSPNTESPSASQEENKENIEKKGKTRIAFSQTQLETLQKLFSSQMYLSPPQIKETGEKLGLTYKQVKTWFQNQRMKLKRTQKEKIWIKNGTCQPQVPKNGGQSACTPNRCIGEGTENFYMDPNYYPGYAYGDNNFPMWTGAHEGYASSPSYGQVPNYNSDPNQIYDNPQNFNQFATVEEWDGSLYGRASGASLTSQATGYISQQMNLYHTMMMEDGYPFSNVSATATATAFPSQPAAFPGQPSTSTAFPCQPSTSTAFPYQPSTSTAFPYQPAAYPGQPSTSTAFPCQPSSSKAFRSQPPAYTGQPSTSTAFACQPSTSKAFRSQPPAYTGQPTTSKAFPFQPSTSKAFRSQPPAYTGQPTTSKAFRSQPPAYPGQPSTSTAFPFQSFTSKVFRSQPATFPGLPSTAFSSEPFTSTAFRSQPAAFPGQPAAFPSQPSTSTAFPSQPAAFPSQPAAFPSQPDAFPSPPATATAFSSPPAAFPSPPATSTAFSSPPAAFPSPPATSTAFSSSPATFPSQPAFQHYQAPSQIPGAQSNFNNA